MNQRVRAAALLEQVLGFARRVVSHDAWVRRAWRELKRRCNLPRYRGPGVIRAFARAYPRAFFIQVGSNDGEQQDPLSAMIRTREWSGIMIEPVPYVFERLAHNYDNNPRLRLENIAIADHEGELSLYHLAKVENPEAENLPPWYDALGSFSREVVVKHVNYIPDIEQRVICTRVPCMTFEALCRKHDVTQLDLLHIDTEGYDNEILKRVDLSRFRPVLIIYEHHHLSVTARAECLAYLASYGYQIFEEGLDTWCLNVRDAAVHNSRLMRLWQV